MIATASLPLASSPIDSPCFGRSRTWRPLPEYQLYEVWMRLATRRQGVRVRALMVDEARTLVMAHFPGWHPEDVTRWQGEGWVAA